MKYVPLKIFALLVVLFFITIIPFSRVAIADEETSTSSEIISNGNFTEFNPSYLLTTPNDWNLSEYFNYDSDNKYIFSSTPNSIASQSKILPVGIYEFSVSAQTVSASAEIIVSAIGDNLSESQSFTVLNEEQSYSFYLFENAVETVTFQIKIGSVTDNCEVNIYSVSVKRVGENVLYTENGASIRTASDSTGLRFKGRVNKTFYDECIAKLGNNNAEVGIMIVPKDYLAEKQFTVEDLGVETPLFIKAEKFNNDSSVNADGYYGFNCAMTNIAPENTDRKFSARTYLKYIINENAYYAYANYDENKHCRSVYEIAERAKQDVDDGLIIDTETITVIDEYLNKIETFTYKYAGNESTQIFEKDDGKIYYFDFTAEKSAVMQIIPEIDESINADIVISVYANEEALMPQNGYYLLPANSEIKICVNGKIIFSVYVCPIKTVTVKLYAIRTQ